MNAELSLVGHFVIELQLFFPAAVSLFTSEKSKRPLVSQVGPLLCERSPSSQAPSAGCLVRKIPAELLRI